MSPHLVVEPDDPDEANFVVLNIEAWWAAVARGEPPAWTAWSRAHPKAATRPWTLGQQPGRRQAKAKAKAK